MNLLSQYFIALLTTGITHLLLGSFVFLKGYNRRINQTYALYSISIAVWAIFEGFGIVSNNQANALLLWRINHMGVIFIPVTFVHFIFSLTGIAQEKRKLISTSYLVALFFVSLNTTNLLIADVVPKFSFRYFISPGQFYYIFFGTWVSWACYGFV